MKKPLFWVFSVEIIITIILALLGFKITYNPDLDNNWDAVSACAAWVGVVVSGLAIYYAIKVPKKIAENQNKIALFEKRYEEVQKIGLIFEEFEKIKNQIEFISLENTNKQQTLHIIETCSKSLSIIHKNISMMYQYLFEQSVCDRITLIYNLYSMMKNSLDMLKGVICKHYNNIKDSEWQQFIFKDQEVLNLTNEILKYCSTVLSIEKDISIDTGKSMDLRKL